MPVITLSNFSALTGEMVDSFRLSSYHQLQDSSEGKIHVLVVVPEGLAATEKSTTAQMVKEIHEKLVQKKHNRYVHSQMSSNKGRELLHDLNIQVELLRTAPVVVGDHYNAEEFKWESICDERGQKIALTEEQQQERYRAYVDANIGYVLSTKELCVIAVEIGHDILTVRVIGHDIEPAGVTDLLVLSDLVKENPTA